jgi:hypothetical protein
VNPGPRSLRAGLLPGQLTTGQQNRVIDYLAARTGLRGEQLWSAFVRASKHAAADIATYRHATTAQPLESRIRDLAAELDAPLTIAAFALAYASGLRAGIDFGRSNAVRERAQRNLASREAEAEAPPPFDPVAAKVEYDAAQKWTRSMGRAARNRR